MLDLNERELRLLLEYLNATLEHPIPIPDPSMTDDAAIRILKMTLKELTNVKDKIAAEIQHGPSR
jgi:hypothetical protein